MSRENAYNAFILKKQPYGEGDELITVYTEEAGKLRVLAKSVKFSKSKLQYNLQSLFLVRLSVAGTHLPRIIGSEAQQMYPLLRERMEAVQAALYGTELLLKFTPDEQKNEHLFLLFGKFLSFLDRLGENPAALPWGLIKYKIEFMEAIGLGVQHNDTPAGVPLGFSMSRGGFTADDDSLDFQPVSPLVLAQYKAMLAASFDDLLKPAANTHLPQGEPAELQQLLSGFVTSQLERDVKSERFLKL